MKIDSIRAGVVAVCAPMLVAASACGCSKKEATGAGEPAVVADGAVTQAGAESAAVTGDGFEGSIEVSMKSARKAAADSFTFETKGKKTRMDLPRGQAGPPGGAGYMIFDADQKKTFMVVDEKKMIIVLDASKLPAPEGAQAVHAPKITKTGKMDTVAGYSCELWDIEKDGKKSTACMSKGIPFFMFDMRTKGTALSWLDDLLDQKAFPLRMIERDATGAETSRFEATKIDKHAVDDARLALPAGYQTMDTSQMMQGLQGMMGGHGGPPKQPGASGQLPPGFQPPTDVKLPPGVKVPPSAQPVR